MSVIAVHIIESPSEADLLADRKEGHALQESLRLHDIPATLHAAISSKGFFKALAAVVEWYNDGAGLLDERTDDAVPVLHVSCHGNDEGLAFSNGDFLAWEDLLRRLHKFSKDLDIRPVVCISCCEGYALRERFRTMSDAPFSCLVGSLDKPTWSETLVGFSTLYYQMGQGVNPLEAVKAVRVAAMHDDFKCVAAKGFSAEWETLVQEARAGNLMRKRARGRK
jgi:hypothetical protein